ncbi:PepSY domain-containing protein [Bergeriella denitrificans]|uniref:Hypothetical periplasmic protein n=1 Tax=Bergeriella denitrificans TaxID=494 RepID=A0A378ULH8_BERDE|nr:PepSY domain-containing protein [Bergeriella denitrificans]STZ77322.1 Hypothetical periplasmic protein [Bergeriella denitrificans]
MKKIFALSLAALTAATLPAVSAAGDYIERQVYESADFPAKRDQAVKMLEAKGYRISDIDVDDRWGKPVLEIEAYKNHQEYDIILSYPDLNIIEERADY